MPLISVIVPVYNVEAYLPACVDSILSQTFSDFELILVDDGSPDACGAMCDSYAQKDSRIRVIHQENGGLSSARNAGLDAAKGQYVTFVDSDDVILSHFLEVLYAMVKENGAAVSCCKFQSFEGNEIGADYIRSASEVNIKTMSGRAAVLSIYGATGEISVTACGKMFLMTLFRGKRFPVGKIHEDQALVPMVLCEAETVVAIDTCDYFYRQHAESIMHKSFSPKRFDNIEGIDGCIDYFQKNGYRDLVSAAKKTRKKVNALLVIDAYSSGAEKLIPQKFHMTKLRAILYCHKYASNETCSWYLGKLSHRAVIIHEYCVKMRQMIRKLCGMKCKVD